MDTMQIIWIVLLVVFIIVEAATSGITSIWFAAGALVALSSTFLGAPMWLQISLFVIVSIALLIITRPLAKKYLNAKVQPTNADKVLGQIVVVTEAVDNVAGTGQVSVAGRFWTARSADDNTLNVGEHAKVNAIEGVKLIIERAHIEVEA